MKKKLLLGLGSIVAVAAPVVAVVSCGEYEVDSKTENGVKVITIKIEKDIDGDNMEDMGEDAVDKFGNAEQIQIVFEVTEDVEMGLSGYESNVSKGTYEGTVVTVSEYASKEEAYATSILNAFQ